MLISLTRRFVRGLNPALLAIQTAANFGKWNRSEIVKKLLEEDELYRHNIAPDNPEFDKDFEAGGWKVKFDEDNTHFEIYKETVTHQAYISTHVKDNPPNLPGDPPPMPEPLRPSRWKKN
jgi:hypothetical protein